MTGVYHTVEGDLHVSSSEHRCEYDDIDAEFKGVDKDEIDEDMLRRDDRREGVRDTLADEIEGM